MIWRYAVGVVAGLALGAWASAAGAEEPKARRAGLGFDVHADFGWYDAVGVGARVDLSVAPDGIIDRVDDELRASFGADVFWFYHAHGGGTGVFPIAALQWNFYVSPAWSVFPELGVAMLFAPDRDRFWRTFIAPFLAAGGRYHFSARNALLLRVGWPAGLAVGVTF